MKNKAVLLAFLALALGVQARVVTEAEAVRAAVALDGAAGGSVTAAKTPDGALYYAVKRPGGGSVILSGETRVEPLLAFSPTDEIVLDEKSPLAALIAADLAARWPSATRLTATGASAAQPTVAEKKWAALLAKGERLAATPPNPIKKESYLDDPRVSPLVETKWAQGQVLATEGDQIVKKNCYNFYTPEYTYVDHVTGLLCKKRCVCGCVATAMAQVLRYWTYPKGEQPSFSCTCSMPDKVTWSETLGRYTSTTKTVTLTSQPGPYVWSWMVEVPGPDTLYPGSLDEIGKLTYACGISVGMDYDIEDEGGSGIFSSEVSRIPKAIRERFGYANAALTGWSAGKNNAILANLDAECPVLLCVTGPAGGHAIVADGYGFKDATRYVHLNMGWSGQLDLWYNLPEIPLDDNPESFDKFDQVVSIVYNINPLRAREYVTGRVLDEDGKPVYGACVTLRAVGDPDSSAVAYSNERGIYCLEADSGKAYSLIAGRENYCSEMLTTPVLANSQSGSAVGNSWGNDLVLHNPSVQLNGGSAIFSTLDAALSVATDDDEIEIIAPTELRADAVVNCPCRIVSMEPSVATVTRVGGARLTVAAGARLELTDVKFVGADSTVVEVAAGGCLALGSGVVFGVSEQTAAVVTQDADGFELALGPEDDPVGKLAESFALDCRTASALGQTFGLATCHPEVAAAQAGRILNFNDPSCEIAGKADGDTSPVALKWAVVPVSIEDATAYYVADGTVETNCFRRLDRLFEALKLADVSAGITVQKDCTLGSRIVLTKDLTIASLNGSTVSDLAASAGFTVPVGRKLTVDGLSFAGMTGDSLFVVEGGALTLGGAMAIENFTGTAGLKSAAVRVTSGGSVVVGSAAGAVTFSNCRNTYGNQSTGGAICAADAGTTVDLRGEVSVTGCHSRGTGGGIHAAKNVKLSLSGRLTVRDNTSGADANLLDSDVYCASSLVTLEVAGLLETGSIVGIRKVADGWNEAGYAFATTAPGFTDPVQIYDSSRAFFCDGNGALKAEPNAANDAFVWFEEAGGVEPVDPSVAPVRVRDADGAEIGCYGSFEDAMVVLDGVAGTIELLRDTAIVSNVTVTSNLVLKSAAGGPFTLSRAAQCEFKVMPGGSLTVAGLTVSGEGASGRLFYVDGGAMVLADGATVLNVSGGTSRNDAAVKVAYGGRFVMKDGSRIADCVNPFVSDAGNGRGGAVSADDESVVRLEGGVIESCSANLGAGVFIGNRSVIEIGGTATVTDNADVGDAVGNVYVPAYCELRLVSPLSGGIGVLQGQTADPVVFGRVADEYAGTDAELAASAHRFRNDRNGDVGFAVRNGTETLLVWSDGLDLDGNYVDGDGKTYVPVAGGAVVKTPLPTAAVALTYNGVEQVGVPAGHGYVLAGNAATHAGPYEATATLKAGFAWEDGSTETVRTIDWSIAPAVLAVKADEQVKYVGTADPALTYTVSGLQGKDTIADALSGELTREAGEEVGSYAILKGSLDLTTADYTMDFTGALLTILEKPVPPTPVPPTTNYPTPIAFQSIVQTAAGQWTLVVTNGVKDCWYSLWGATELDLGSFQLIERRQVDADGPVTFEPANVQSADGQWFWQARGEPGEVRE